MPKKEQQQEEKPPVQPPSSTETMQRQESSTSPPLSQGTLSTLLNMLETASDTVNGPVVYNMGSSEREREDMVEGETSLTIDRYAIEAAYPSAGAGPGHDDGTPTLSTGLSSLTPSQLLFGGDPSAGHPQQPPQQASTVTATLQPMLPQQVGWQNISNNNNIPPPGTTPAAPAGPLLYVPYPEYKQEYMVQQQTEIPPAQTPSPVLPFIAPPTSVTPQHAADVPSTVIYPGPLDFQVNVLRPNKNVVSKNWTYWSEERRLYVDRSLSCPFELLTRYPVLPGTILRAMMVFRDPQNVRQSVTRCYQHELNDSKTSPISALHLIQCDHPMAQYQIDSVYERRSVVIPFESPQAGCTSIRVNYAFSCMTSCSGGPNRRAMQAVFTIEHPEGNVLGRQVIGVRVCACPVRDMNTDMKRSSKQQQQQGAKATQQPNTPTATTNTGGNKKNKRGIEQVTDMVSVSKRPSGGDGNPSQVMHPQQQSQPQQLSSTQLQDNTVYELRVRGRENYELLRRIRNSLELSAMVPDELRQTSRRMESLQRQWLREEVRRFFHDFFLARQDGNCNSTDSEQ